MSVKSDTSKTETRQSEQLDTSKEETTTESELKSRITFLKGLPYFEVSDKLMTLIASEHERVDANCTKHDIHDVQIWAGDS
jgi:bacterioferritin (cytochrome b1)